MTAALVGDDGWTLISGGALLLGKKERRKEERAEGRRGKVGGESKVLGVEAGVMDFGEKGEVEVKHYK